MQYYKIYPQFADFAKEISTINLQSTEDYKINGREEIYNTLRLPMKSFEGKTKTEIDKIVKKHFDLDVFFFSIIESQDISKIHTDTHYKKQKKFQRYCNFAFPISGNLENRITFWPKLDKKDKLECFKTSMVNDESLSKYMTKSTWHDSVTHKQYQPVLLNTFLPHAAVGQGKTLFAYITLIGKTFEDCIDIYDAMIK